MEDPQSQSPVTPTSTPTETPVVRASAKRVKKPAESPSPSTPTPVPKANADANPAPQADEQRIVFRKPAAPKTENPVTATTAQSPASTTGTTERKASVKSESPAPAKTERPVAQQRPVVNASASAQKTNAASSKPAKKASSSLGAQRHISDSQQKVPRPQPHVSPPSVSPHHILSERGKTDYVPYLVVGVIVLILAYLFFSGGSSAPPSETKTITKGMDVKVHYVGSFVNGTLFDTSVEAKAKEAGLYDERRPYEPLDVKVGAGAVIQGFDDALVGMKVGEKKKVTIPAEQAYGSYDPNNTQTVPRVTKINRTLTLDRQTTLAVEQFEAIFGAKPEMGKTYSDTELPWNFSVTAVEAANVTVQMDVSKGQKYQVPDSPWPSVVTVVDDEKVVLKHEPNSTIVPTPLGNATIKVNAQELVVTINPSAGGSINTVFGPLNIKEVTADNIVLDQNHPLAGQTLVFELEVVSVA